MIVSTSCSPQKGTTPLRVFIAGSLMVPFEALEQAYEEKYPEIDVQVEAHGSIQVIRHVTEIHDLIDVVVTADYALIPMLMYSNFISGSGEPYADWYIKFASNRMVLAYSPQSRSAEEISAENWFEIIARPDVKLGLSDPRFDSAGYRSLMIVQLAERYYDNLSLFERVYLGRFKEPITVEKVGQKQIIHVPELLDTTEESNIVMRGGSVALLALLESGDIDYAFEYESVAQQHNLPYVELPPELNLSDPTYAADYENVQVHLDFQRFSSIKPEFSGDLIGYGITIPNNAPNPQAAQDFVTFFLGEQGAALMETNNHPVFKNPQVDNCIALPENLTNLCKP
jgi:molybdate/tungstate transport system substrate-binding protein